MSIGTILIAVLVFGVLVFVHELGHFLAARASGIQVNEFALGMGPKLVSVMRGGTRYSLRIFPMGGFCAMEGENEDSNSENAFCNAKLWKRMIVMVAGSAMNMLLGLILLGFLTSQMNLIGTTQIASFYEGASSGKSLREGDVIKKMDGHTVNTYNDLQYEMMRNRDGIMDIEVIRGGERLLIKDVTFEMMDMPDNAGRIIVRDFTLIGVPKTFGNVLSNTFNWTLSMSKMVWGSFTDLITGRFGLNQISGPVGVTTVISEASKSGIPDLMFLISFITINLSVFNMLPFPALDGGRLLFLFIEGIRRKPIGERFEGIVNMVGFALLIGLMIFATFNDILRLV